MIVLVPLARDEWAALRSGATLTDVGAHAPTPALGATFDLDDPEELERAALLVASVAALLRTGERLVASVDAPYVADPAGRLGEARVPALRLADVSAYFVDDPQTAPVVVAAAAAAAGLDVDTAWDVPEVQGLLAHDLLWHGASEPLA